MIPQFIEKLSASILVLAIVAGSQFSAFARVNNAFSAPYNLIVHSENQNQPVSRIKALESLLKYFNLDKADPKNVKVGFLDLRPKTKTYDLVARGCVADLWGCSKGHFSPYESLSLRDFIDWFFTLKYTKYPQYLEKQYPEINKASTRHWMEARRLNLVIDGDFTYKAMQEFLYRHSVSEANSGLPYNDVLILSNKEITAQNYHNFKEIDSMVAGLDDFIAQLNVKLKLSPDEKKFKEKLISELDAFNKLKISLAEEPYVLRTRSNLDDSVAGLVRHFGLQDVLYSYSYDYSKNPAYRKHNLVTGAKKIHGKLLMPGEILDFWKTLTAKGMGDFKYGWVIANGQEEWLFGGGICGSATLLFIPVWKTGLEILERRNHSLFYSSLYPKENIGLDATVFRPSPNLKFRNNLDSPVVFNVIDDKEKQMLTIEVLGNQNYKDVQIEGPIFIKKNVIKWVRHLIGFDGKITSEAIESRYSAIY